MMPYRALSQKLIMLEKARFCDSFLTVVKAPEKAAQAQAVSVIERRRPRKGTCTRNALRIGPQIPTTEEIDQSR